jgi:hypothetical protein
LAIILPRLFHYLSLVFIFLMVKLVTIKLIKTVSERRRRRLSESELDPLLSSPSRKPNSALFDLWLARISLVVDVIAYTAMPFASTGLAFAGFTVLSSFGSGFSPAVQSTAMELYTQRTGGSVEAGRLFGAMSVIQALS